jgi:hypothetical protein
MGYKERSKNGSKVFFKISQRIMVRYPTGPTGFKKLRARNQS